MKKNKERTGLICGKITNHFFSRQLLLEWRNNEMYQISLCLRRILHANYCPCPEDDSGHSQIRSQTPVYCFLIQSYKPFIFISRPNIGVSARKRFEKRKVSLNILVPGTQTSAHYIFTNAPRVMVTASLSSVLLLQL